MTPNVQEIHLLYKIKHVNFSYNSSNEVYYIMMGSVSLWKDCYILQQILKD